MVVVMKLTLDLVSDVSCPWCIIGYQGLAMALEQLSQDSESDIEIELNWLPFEINPGMAPEGEPLAQYLSRKYGMSASQRRDNNATITQRGRDVGFEFMPLEQRHVYNSFDCHRLLHLAKLHQLQTPLKLALFEAYFGQGVDISDTAQLSRIALSVGLPAALVEQVLSGQLYRPEVLAQQQKYQERGVTSVPMLIVNDQYGIAGAQTPAAYQDMLLRIIDELQEGDN
jgi:predicted DsbA family dithiol-disulfide isomerase